MEIRLEDKTYTAGRIFCAGLNYLDHIHELGSKMPENPVIFLKQSGSLVPPGKDLRFPTHGKELHYETELILLIGKSGRIANISDARSFICGIGLGFDLTLRDLQTKMKKAGLPWEISKAFDDSATFSEFVPVDEKTDLANIEFTGRVNGEIKQKINTSQMIFSAETLVAWIGGIWKLEPGDLVYTGTPVGVGPLQKTDTFSVEGSLFDHSWEWKFLNT